MSNHVDVHVYPTGRLGNLLYFAAAATSASLAQPSSRIVWHGQAAGLASVQRLLGMDNVRRSESRLIRRLLDCDPRPLASRSLSVRLVYSVWWRTRTIGRSLLPDVDGALESVRAGTSVLVRDFHQRFEPVAHLLGSIGSELPVRLESLLTAEVLRQMQLARPIAVHMRFTDALSPSHRDRWGALSGDWYAQAVRLALARQTDVKQPLWLFTDDVEAATQVARSLGADNFRCAAEFGLDEVQELALMALCPTKIISNSTYSWWAGYLSNSDAVVIAPRPLMRSGEREGAADPHWLRIDAEWVEQ